MGAYKKESEFVVTSTLKERRKARKKSKRKRGSGSRRLERESVCVLKKRKK